ncbi:NACHT, LRR and PYD domains-containing protein 2 [Lepus europaeus]|uniref:NACHT, LRR and PYD domains-containing protein 2 n=1 Tax=Lepus europaeus TaxID=9983 RepID=UPI002B47CA52|nr:NACHT, LRR and PYD domains-containing protein 2 [Lepus europaeus]
MEAVAPSRSFNLPVLLEQLDQDELTTFKNILRNLSQQNELQQVAPAEIKEADGRQLAEMLADRCPRYWVETVTVQVFEKMNRMDLSEQAKDELGELSQKSLQEKPMALRIVWTHPAKCARMEDPLERLKDPAFVSCLKCGVWIVPANRPNGSVLSPPPRLAGPAEDKEDAYRSVLKQKFAKAWEDDLRLGDAESIQAFARRYEALIPFCSPKAHEGPFPHTVVLQGPAGVGKSVLARKVLRDWLQRGLGLPFQFAFYLSCPELRGEPACTFAELLCRDCPELRDAVVRGATQARHVLLVLDGFDELRAPTGALVSDICGDWTQPKPVPVLLSSLLKRKLLPRATVLVTTRPQALRELRILVEQPLLIQLHGFSEQDRRLYFLRRFPDEAQALRALDAVRGNAALFELDAAPAVCWLTCACLGAQLERGEDPAAACATTTELFLRFLCGRCAPGPHLRAALGALSRLAARGVWAQVSGFCGPELRALGLAEQELRPFVASGVLREDGDRAGSYSFAHLSVQQCLGALFYLLEAAEGGAADDDDVGPVRQLFSTKARADNPGLAWTGRFLFGLLNQERARELEAAFGCRVSARVLQELLGAEGGRPVLAELDTAEALCCLHESQDDALVREAMVPFQELTVHLRDTTELVQAAFCLQRSQNLQSLWLQVDKAVFAPDAADKEAAGARSRDDKHLLLCWTNLCSVLGSNSKLAFLDISQSVLSAPAVQVLCDHLAASSCCLQKLALRNTQPEDAYRDLCLSVHGHRTVTHLTLQGSDQVDTLPPLCEVLRHPYCQLQYLQLASCSATTQQWAALTLALGENQSLMFLNLTAVELLDTGAKLLCVALRHPRCPLQRLSLESCYLTEASCKELSSALIVNQRLTHLSLAENDLGDGGVKMLCEGLSYPECCLRVLVLWCCNVTSEGCAALSQLLQQTSSLTHLDLGLNHIGLVGLRFLCEALKDPCCSLQCLWLWGCSIPPFSCADLSSVLAINQTLVSLDLGQNSLGFSGVKMLCEALKLAQCPLRTLRLKIDESDAHVQKVLRETRESNPQLHIESDSRDPRRPRPSAQDFIF